MNKNLLFSFIFLFLSQHQIFSQEYMVHVAAFNQRVDNSYFEGIANITEVKDRNDIYHYYIMGLNANDAAAKTDELRKKNYKAYIIDAEKKKQDCKVTCSNTAEIIDIKSLQWIFFDFDKADLRSSSRKQLSSLATIMRENPTYTVEFSAHTDAKGTTEYNQALSERRANNTKGYILNNGVKNERIKVVLNGEISPIARNEINGRDTEAGRQFNRRIEIRIFDAKGEQMNLVEKPVIPRDLL
jgi:outer membrane protein OmpA-like peptidoglycan-associated protein